MRCDPYNSVSSLSSLDSKLLLWILNCFSVCCGVFTIFICTLDAIDTSSQPSHTRTRTHILFIPTSLPPSDFSVPTTRGPRTPSLTRCTVTLEASTPSRTSRGPSIATTSHVGAWGSRSYLTVRRRRLSRGRRGSTGHDSSAPTIGGGSL